ncbi:type II secretion system F family protein [Thermostaphylospora chromogena]|nr:type II secretion system F family protein [Thermostaphylospora chromogena]
MPSPSAAATVPSTSTPVEWSSAAVRRSPVSMFLGLGKARTPFRRPGSSSAAARWRACSIELCQALRAELAAGRPAGEALARAISWVEFPDPSAVWAVVAAARDGGDVPAALRAVAPSAGGEGLRRLAVCWQVAAAAGAGLATLVDRVEAMLRADEAHRQEVAAQLSGPRATARLLAVLPVLGVSMGAALGMNPFAFLFGTPAGLMCLLTGLTLAAGGVVWTRHLVRRAESG